MVACIGLLSVSTVAAQSGNRSRLTQKDTIRDKNIVYPEMMLSDVDASLVNWFGQKVHQNKNCSPSGKSYTDQDYINKLAKLPTVMEMPYNQVIRSYIDLYSERRKGQVSNMLGLSKFYFPIFEEELAKNSMPLELKYLPIIESALNPTALSRAGASGLWQFMYSTGKIYDLNVDSFVDERRDPIKSTKAAIKYLKDLYGIYQDWYLVIAAYNCGPGNVNKAIRRSNGQKDYWAVYDELPRETRGYVPAFIAATYIMNYYQDHGICPGQSQSILITDTVHVTDMMHFEQISEILSVPVEEIRALNPQYKIDIVPGNVSTQVLRLPVKAALAFACNKDSICTYRANDFLVNNRRTVDIGGGSYNGKTRISTVTHRVQRGETLAGIAGRYRVTSSDIRKWNNLKGGSVKKGQRLRIHREVPVYGNSSANSGSSSKSDNNNNIEATQNNIEEPSRNGKTLAEIVMESPNYSDKNRIDDNTNTAETTTTKTPAPPKKEQPQVRKTETPKQAVPQKYTVKKGDTLYSIAQRNGTSVDELMKANNIPKSGTVKIGQVLKIPKK